LIALLLHFRELAGCQERVQKEKASDILLGLVVLRSVACAVLVSILLLSLFVVAAAQLSAIGASHMQSSPQYSLQVGAWGDYASTASMGVQAEIRTRTYLIHRPSLMAAFWVGENLDNGGFVQFGYVLQPAGKYCEMGVVANGQSRCVGGLVALGAIDASWFWEYYPNRDQIHDYYSGLGPSDSAGLNGTWHLYSIMPNRQGGWDFILDGKRVSSIALHSWAPSSDPVYIVAEEITSSPKGGGILASVEFRNLAYLKQDGWHQVAALNGLAGCGISRPSCDVSIPYEA
jgi:hypothetical protein